MKKKTLFIGIALTVISILVVRFDLLSNNNPIPFTKCTSLAPLPLVGKFDVVRTLISCGQCAAGTTGTEVYDSQGNLIGHIFPPSVTNQNVWKQTCRANPNGNTCSILDVRTESMECAAAFKPIGGTGTGTGTGTL